MARQYDEEFKRNAINLIQTSGKTPTEIAVDLGIPDSTLFGWIKKGIEGAPSKGDIDEILRLRKELADARMERDILKKAISIFSK